ncbi:hypothetical protein GE061_008468 [Apolygus lucorum]|uniref:MULE transposase domain-containing protein n=1 Tax=Apolygus lucorum TaxID=248454 RepID=A0A8S9WSB8_APOLU|nr:hypothetical protein GE061_008468 [Apolygus lucorum]
MKVMREAIYRERRKHIPTIPTSRENAVYVLQERSNEILFESCQFCFVSPSKNIVLFTCAQNLEALTASSNAFGDGTFSYCPQFFSQLYTIHIHKLGYYVPVVFALLPSKTTECYIEMWDEVKSRAVQLVSKERNLTSFYADFETAAHNAVVHHFPTVRVIGCRFHLGQSWFRKIQKSTALNREYKNKESEIGQWLKLFFGLPLLPPAAVGDAFCELVIRAYTPACHDFAEYVLANYIDADSQFPPPMWAGEPTDEPRTTNGPESFHRHFNSQFYTAHPNVHCVLSALLEIQVETKLKLTSIRKNQPNGLRNEKRKKREFLQNVWMKYDSGDIGALEYLNNVAHKFAPAP